MPSDEYWNEFDKIADDWEKMASLAVAKTIADIHATVTEELAGPKSGHQRDDGHVASAPGEPPANDTGNLSASVRHGMLSSLEGEVVVGAEYGIYLEMGTVRMAPRPFLAPAVEKHWDTFVKAMEQITK